MLFTLFFYLTAGLNINIKNNTVVEKVAVSLNVESQTYIQTLDDLGKILSIKFNYGESQQQFCASYYQGVTIHQSPTGFVSLVHELNRKDIDEITEQELYQGYNEKTSAYAVNDEGVCILSSKGVVYFVSNQDSQDIKVRNSTLPNFNSDQASPQIVFDEKSRNFLVILSDSVVKVQFFNDEFTSNNVQGWTQPSNYYKVVASNGWLYSAQGEQGLVIYEIQQHGLKLEKTISAIDLYDSSNKELNILDVAVIENQVYILDQINGITVFNTYFNGTFVKNGKLGLIPLVDGISFEVKGSTLILIQNFKTSSQIIELYISNSEWIEMRKINTKSKLRRADIIDDTFAIIRGLHDHKIMLIQMADAYLDLEAKRLDNYFFSGNLIGVDRFGKNNETLFAISPHGFYLFNFKPYPSLIICNAGDLDSGNYNVQMQVKSTKCSDTDTKQLEYCMTNFEYNFDVKKPLLSAEQQQAYIYMAVLLASIAGALILCLIYHYRRYQVQKENINWQIEKQKKKRKDIQS